MIMSQNSPIVSLPPAIERFANVLRLAGWIGFVSQLTLAIISSVILLVAVIFGTTRGSGANNPGTGGGLFFAVCGLLVLYASVYQAFRYIRLSRQLRSPTPSLRPSKSYTVSILRLGLMVSLVGMALTIIGGSAITGTLVAKSLTQPRTFFDPATNLRGFIEPLDLFVVQANTNTILAHFMGIAGVLWLLYYINKPSS